MFNLNFTEANYLAMIILLGIVFITLMALNPKYRFLNSQRKAGRAMTGEEEHKYDYFYMLANGRSNEYPKNN